MERRQRGGVGSQVKAIGRVLACSAPEGDGTDPAPVFLPLLLVIAGTLLVQILSRPFVRAALRANLPLDWSEARIEQALARVSLSQQIGLVAAPLFLALKLLGIAAILFLLILVQNGDARYRKTLSLVSIASILPLLASWLVLGMLSIRGLEAIRSFRDLQPAIGLAMLAPNSSPAVFTLLNNFNVFEGWYLLVMTLGVANLGQLPKKGAALISAAVWTLCVGVQIAFVSALGR